MRAYKITVSKAGDPTAILASYSTFNADGSYNPNALKVELDCPVYAYGDPAGAASVKIYGVDFSQIRAPSNFNDMDIMISGGMSKGLPLANPAQFGVLLQGTIFQAFGNWQGGESSLQFFVYAKKGTHADPVNLSYTWKAGETLQDMVTQVLRIAYPGCTVSGGFASSLVYTEDQPLSYTTMADFAQRVLQISRVINPDPNYHGAQIRPSPSGFVLYDDTTRPAAKELSPLDLIGQPTWLNPGQLQVRTVMRADIQTDDVLKLPVGSNVINVPSTSNVTRDRNALGFQGEFSVVSVRHLGNSRQNGAESWMTVFDCTAPPASTSP